MTKPAPRAEMRPHHQILSLEATSGFFEGVPFDFADGPNCLLGVSGSGKTLVMELVRFALGRDPDDEADPDEARRFKSYLKKRLDAGGLVRLRIRTKDGAEYRVERAFGEPAPRVYDSAGKPVAVDLKNELFFRVDLYGQNEIVEIASDPKRQLALIDRFVDGGLLRRIGAEIKKVGLQLEENAARTVTLDGEIRDREDAVRELPTLAEKLKGFASASGSASEQLDAALRGKALREKERKAILALREESRHIADEVDSVLPPLVRRLEGRIPVEIAAGPNGGLFEAIVKRVRALESSLDEARNAIRSGCEHIAATLEKQAPAIESRHAEQESLYRELIEKSKEERARAADRAETQSRFDDIVLQQRELEAKHTDREARKEERRRLLARLSELRDERWRARDAVAKSLTAHLEKRFIRVSIDQNGDTAAYRELLSDALRTPGAKQTGSLVSRLDEFFPPDELARALQGKDAAATLATKARMTEANASRVVERLSCSERIYEIETVDVDDLPQIELMEGGTGRPVCELSTGQRCTAILPILLLDSDGPLLVDQPEDNLDNEFVYKTVVASVLESKGRRQLLFATHNANLATLSESGRIFILAADAAHGRILDAGTIDEITEQVEIRVEGGRIAFLARKEKYGHP